LNMEYSNILTEAYKRTGKVSRSKTKSWQSIVLVYRAYPFTS
jgi:hypothetical protein